MIIMDIPNKFFEKITMSNTNTKKDLKDYGELWGAEFFHVKQQNGENHNHKMINSQVQSIQFSTPVRMENSIHAREFHTRSD